MRVTYAFACLPVASRDQAVAWYQRLFGRPPTFLPNEDEAVWQVADTASMYVLTDPDRAGQGIVTLIVDGLDATLAEMGARGIAAGDVEIVGTAGRKSTIVDPDGNRVSIVELNQVA
jgi:predicted enzyme related to lactoylglutathione lyase